MAAVTIPAPGTEFGPCLCPECGHVDCAESRRQASTLCDICRLPIGYSNRFYQHDEWKVLTHQLCYMRKLDPGWRQ